MVVQKLIRTLFAAATVLLSLAPGWAAPAAAMTPPELPNAVHAIVAPPSPLPKAGALAGQPCPAWVHDRYLVTGPNGQKYRTWHAQIDPVYKCQFDHEHGDDPRTSAAARDLPAFGYAADVAGMAEPHSGFKVQVFKRGQCNGEGRCGLFDGRIVYHMGTTSPLRFGRRDHSLIVDAVSPDGHVIHGQGMADTGQPISVCDRGSTDLTRTAMFVKPRSCEVSSKYEIWPFSLKLADRATITVFAATFDPITTFDPANPTKVIYTKDAWPELTADEPHSCRREAYLGPFVFTNKAGAGVFWTDPMTGQLTAPGMGLPQRVSLHGDIPMTSAYRNRTGAQTQFKLQKDYCGPGLGLDN